MHKEKASEHIVLRFPVVSPLRSLTVQHWCRVADDGFCPFLTSSSFSKLATVHLFRDSSPAWLALRFTSHPEIEPGYGLIRGL